MTAIIKEETTSTNKLISGYVNCYTAMLTKFLCNNYVLDTNYPTPEYAHIILIYFLRYALI